MIIWFFTLLDIFVFLVVLLAQTGLVADIRLFILAAGYLIVKGILFRGEILSAIDLIIGIYIIFMIFGARWFLSYLVLAWFAYKFAFTFFNR